MVGLWWGEKNKRKCQGMHSFLHTLNNLCTVAFPTLKEEFMIQGSVVQWCWNQPMPGIILFFYSSTSPKSLHVLFPGVTLSLYSRPCTKISVPSPCTIVPLHTIHRSEGLALHINKLGLRHSLTGQMRHRQTNEQGLAIVL